MRGNTADVHRRPEKTRKKPWRHQLKTSHTTAASGGMTCLLPSPAGGPSIQNQEKIGCLIQAVLRVVACPFLGTLRALLCGEVMRIGTTDDDLQRFF